MAKKRVYKLGLSIILLFASFTNFSFAQERIEPPKMRYEVHQKDGCVDNLNKEGLKLQKEGLELFDIKGKIFEAVKLLESAIEKEPKLIPSYNQLAAYYCLGQHDCTKAIALMKKDITHCPKEPVFYFTLGNIYAQNKEYIEAINNLNKAKDFGFEPKPSLFYNLGNNYAQLKKFDDAIENYKETLRHDKKHFGAWQNLIITYYEKGDKNNAIKLANELAKIDGKGEYGAWAKEAIRELGRN